MFLLWGHFQQFPSKRQQKARCLEAVKGAVKGDVGEANGHPYPRRTIDQSGTVYKVDSSLTIENVTMQDGGLYICKTFNVTRLEANVTVTVYDVPFGLQTDPQVKTIVGNDVRLTCRASKYIYSHLAWYYPSSEAAPGDSLIKKMDNYSISLTLVIPNVTREQSGLYKCRAQNQHNSTDTLEQHTRLLVRAKVAPYVIQNLTDLEVNISGKIILECKVSGRPEPQITWKKNGYPISAASGPTTPQRLHCGMHNLRKHPQTPNISVASNLDLEVKAANQLPAYAAHLPHVAVFISQTVCIH
ncbi:vascular endothelial growth factor receptor kdr- hypothetical protein [Limosa lapponica baueri]|uniref:Ig-like domain-containing protein n=1 Tax=Limosa lapponica baueri TaxID=1758121 RepID=A0A2I0TJ63_LIMLA|nr:vascular endothelial growth factor receptor kdr- hypothetical protein [Limosa lapponica baueri]